MLHKQQEGSKRIRHCNDDRILISCGVLLISQKVDPSLRTAGRSTPLFPPLPRGELKGGGVAGKPFFFTSFFWLTFFQVEGSLSGCSIEF
jgi:hypothetical protein